MKPLDRIVVEREIDALMTSCPELADDETLRHDMIGGETGAFELLDKLVKRAGECLAEQTGLDGYIRDLQSRADRLERRYQGLRTLVRRLMECADLHTARLASATVSLSAGRPKVMITAESAIPDDYCRIKREPNKTAIRTALEAGEHVPGTVLSNAEPNLTIRTK